LIGDSLAVDDESKEKYDLFVFSGCVFYYTTNTLISPEGLSLVVRKSNNIRSVEKQLLIAKNQTLQVAELNKTIWPI